MKSILLNILIAVISIPVFAQVKIPEELIHIKRQMEGAVEVAYKYTIEQKTDAGEVNKTNGQIQKGKDYYYELNDQQLVLQTDKWFYKVDHSAKVVYVIDAEKVRTKILKAKPNLDATYLIPDSILLKHGKINITHENNLVKINVIFSKEVLIKNIYVEYDKGLAQIVLMKVRMLYPYVSEGWSLEERYIDQLFTADNFSVKSKIAKPRIGDYFILSKGKIILKRYSNYELITEV